jgi:hypothetical protein
VVASISYGLNNLSYRKAHIGLVEQTSKKYIKIILKMHKINIGLFV